MIIRLQGKLFKKQAPYLGVDVNGIGYGLQASLTTFAYLPECGQDVTLYTHLLIREDAHQLFGFIDHQEKEMFLTLIKVNGVGPKLALAILSTLDTAQLVHAVQQDDVTGLTRIPGIGKKTAERLLIELRDKVDLLGDSNQDFSAVSVSVNPQSEQYIKQEASEALQALGYKPHDASRAVQKAFSEGIDVEAVIRAALKG